MRERELQGNFKHMVIHVLVDVESTEGVIGIVSLDFWGDRMVAIYGNEVGCTIKSVEVYDGEVGLPSSVVGWSNDPHACVFIGFIRDGVFAHHCTRILLGMVSKCEKGENGNDIESTHAWPPGLRVYKGAVMSWTTLPP